MAAIGIDGVHKVIGYFCDLCGEECEGDKEELNALGCTYPGCEAEASVYHQDCIEKYLKSIRCEKNRKTGYHCPRGSGRNSKYSDAPCPGRVTKSHPIHIRNEQAKKRQKSKAADVVPASTRPVKGKPKAAVATAKLKAPAPKPTGVKIKILRQEAAIKPLLVAKAPDVKPREVSRAAPAAMDKDQAIAWQKALGHAAEYQKLGYSQPQSIAAVNKWGDDMQGAVAWLVQSNLGVMQGALHPELPTIDVSEELHYLWSCQQVFTPSKAVLQQIGWQQQQAQLLTEAMQGAGQAPVHSRGEQQA
ncbi:hypothetical protein WJX79_003932 [Trebouxia sp. C0005]